MKRGQTPTVTTTYASPTTETHAIPRLHRSATDRVCCSVCGGIADYLAVDPTVIRVAWAVLTIVPGGIVLGVIAYLAAWFIMPEPHVAATVPAPRTA